MTDIGEIKAALAAATPGPWFTDWDLHGNDIAVIQETGTSGFTLGSIAEDVPTKADAILIASAPSWLGELIERCERAEEALRPFAALFVHDTWHDTTRINGVTVGNVRAARAALGDQ